MRQFQSNDPPGEGACVPIRWVLNDVIFHCDSLWKERGVFTSRDSFPRPSDVNNQFGLNTDTEYNIYIMTHNEASGEANGLGGSANSMVTNGFSRGLFNHEMGHVLGLRHSWGFDRIDDTPETAFDFDLNCDGTISSSEMNLQCWNNFASQNPIPSWNHSTGSFPNACDAGPPCAEQHPCCGWTNQNNNFMAYNAHNDCCGACTHGQIRVMVQTINDDQCDYIEDIGGDCPPPMPILEVLPVQNMYETNCSFCFYIGASMNETAYKMEFFEAASHTLVHTTGLLPGPAPKTYCIDVSGKTLSWANGFQAGTDYIARLTVENGCGNQKEKELQFTLPSNCIPKNPPTFDWLKMPAPNPHNEDFSFQYEIFEEGELEIVLVNAIAPEYQLSITNEVQVQPGIYEPAVSTQGLPYGIYALIVRYNNEIQSLTILKQAQ